MSEENKELSDSAKTFLKEYGGDFEEATPLMGAFQQDVVIEEEKSEIEVEVAEAGPAIGAPEVPSMISESRNKVVLWEKLKKAPEGERQAVYGYLGLGPKPTQEEVWRAYAKL